MAKTAVTREIEKELVAMFMWRPGRFALEVTTLAEHGRSRKGYAKWKAERLAKNPDWKPKYWWNGHVDFCTYEGGTFTFFEIKVSVSDFKSKNGHNLIAHKNYYCVPIEIYDKIVSMVPKHVGIYIYDPAATKKLYCKKKCKRVKSILDEDRPGLSWAQSRREIQLEHMMTALNTRVWRLTCNSYHGDAGGFISAADFTWKSIDEGFTTVGIEAKHGPSGAQGETREVCWYTGDMVEAAQKSLMQTDRFQDWLYGMIFGMHK